MFFFFFDNKTPEGMSKSLIENISEPDFDLDETMDKIQREAERQGLRNIDLVELSGLPKSKVSKLLSKKQKPTSDDIKLLARSLGYTPDPFIYSDYDMRTYKLKEFVRPLSNAFDAFFDALDDDLETDIIKYEIPLSIVVTLGVNASEYAFFTSDKSQSGFKYDINSASDYIRFAHRATFANNDGYPEMAIIFSPDHENYAVCIDWVSTAENRSSCVGKCREILQVEKGTIDDFDVFYEKNSEWLPERVKEGNILSFGASTQMFPGPGELESALIDTFKQYCALIWELFGMDILPEKLKMQEDLTPYQTVDILNGYADFPLDIKEAVKTREKFSCEIDKAHESFLTDQGERYMDVVPLVPFSYGMQFKKAIMSECNGVCLCPTCAAKYVHGRAEDREDMLIKLYRKHKNELEDAGIDLSLAKVLDAHQLS
jgi:transcriptional regulator with XRE-family HTH domain